MARIRNIKPEFWDDEDLGRLPRDCRLLFVGLWNQADKSGRLEDRPARLFARLFPYDRDIDEGTVDAWLQMLSDAKFIERYSCNSKRLIQILQFTKHQYLSKHEPESVLPGPGQSETGTVPVPAQDEPGETGRFDKGQGTRDKGQRKREESTTSDEVVLLPSAEAVHFIAFWNDGTSPPIPRCQELTPKRRKAIAARLKDRPLDEWPAVISRIDASHFCNGQNDRGWVATIDWVLQPDTATKVLEGKYDNRQGAAGRQPANRAPDPQAAHWWEDCQHQPKCETGPMHRQREAVDSLKGQR